MKFCKKHNLQHTLSFDPTNSFCLECEMEAPKEESVKPKVDVFKVPAPPVGIQYCYAVLGNPLNHTVHLERTESRAVITAKNINARVGKKFRVAKVETYPVCVDWNNGLSKEMYKVFEKGKVPKHVKGNTAVIVEIIELSKGSSKTKKGKTVSKPILTPKQTTPQSTPAPSSPVKKQSSTGTPTKASTSQAPKPTTAKNILRKLKNTTRKNPRSGSPTRQSRPKKGPLMPKYRDIKPSKSRKK